MRSNIGKEGGRGGHHSKQSSHMIEYLCAALFTHITDLIAPTGVRIGRDVMFGYKCNMWVLRVLLHNIYKAQT